MSGARAFGFVGREREVDALRTLLDDVREGRVRIALIEGEAGIGKTRLLEEALRDQGAFEIFRAKCEELDRTRAFAPLADAFGCGRGTPDPQGAKIAELLAEATATEEISNRHSLVIDAFLDLIEQRAIRRPTVLVLDDLQWADPATLTALRSFSKRLAYVGVAILGTARPVPRAPELERLLIALQDEGALGLALEPLDNEQVGRLVERALDARPDAELTRFIAGAAGNPLFIGELLGALDREGAIEVEAGRATLAMTSQPPDVHLTILRRITFLSPEALQCLRFGAILGSTFLPADLAVVAGTTLPSLVGAIDECVRARLLEEHDDRLRFRHDLIRESLYLDVPEGVRAGLHLDAARALEQANAPLLQVVQHLLLGARRVDAEAARTMWRAALEGESSSAGRVELLERAVWLLPPTDPDRDALEADLVETMVWGGRPSDGEQRALEVLRRAPDRPIASRMRLSVAEALRLGARFEEMVAAADGWLAKPDVDEAERVALMSASAYARGVAIAFDPAEAERIGRAALEMAEKLDDDALIVAALTGLSLAMNRTPNMESLELARRAVEIAESHPEARYLTYNPHWHLGHATLGLGQDPDGAERVFRTGLRIAEERGLVAEIPLYLDGLAFVHFNRWQWDEAVAEAEASIAAAEEVGTMVRAAGTLSLLAHVSILRGEFDKAVKHIQAEAALTEQFGSQIGMAHLSHRAMVHDVQGDLQAALEIRWDEFKREQQFGGAQVSWWQVMWLALVLGDAVRAEEVVAWLSAAAEHEGGFWIREAELARTMVARDPSAIRAAIEASMGPTAVGMDPGIAAHERAAVAFAWAGLADQAIEHFEAIRPTYERVGAFPWLDRIARHMQGLGVHVPRRRRRARAEHGWEALTDAERRVAELAAQGLTNPQIGERLFISRRTVQTHLAHAFAKLGISSRVELATEVARRAGA